VDAFSVVKLLPRFSMAVINRLIPKTKQAF
jgi:hypothetical protein